MSMMGLAVVLILAGFLLMVAELFIPSGGVISILSACAIIAGIVLAFQYDSTAGLWTLVGVGIALPISFRLMLHYWPKTAVGKRMFLTVPDEDTTLASMPETLELERLRGHIGQAQSSLRPAGVVEFDGRRIDCMAEGAMVERGQFVRCIDVKGNKVIVRPVEKPIVTDLVPPDFS